MQVNAGPSLALLATLREEPNIKLEGNCTLSDKDPDETGRDPASHFTVDKGIRSSADRDWSKLRFVSGSTRTSRRKPLPEACENDALGIILDNWSEEVVGRPGASFEHGGGRRGAEKRS